MHVVLVHEFSPHARFATQHQVGRVDGFVERQRIARVEFLPITRVNYVIEVPTGRQQHRMPGFRGLFQLLRPQASPHVHHRRIRHHHPVLEHLLPNDRVGLKRVRDTKKPADIFALEKIVTGHVARLHVRIDLGIALPTIEWHLVSAQMDVLIREHLHDLGEQVAEELVQSRIRRIHRAQFTIRLSLHIVTSGQQFGIG